MADTKISNLDAAEALDGSEIVPIVQDGDTVRTTVKKIMKFGKLSGGDDDPEEVWGVRAWAYWEGDGPVGEYVSGARRRGIQAISHTVTGVYLVTLEDGLDHDRYAVSCTAQLVGAGASKAALISIENVNTATFRVRTCAHNGAATDAAQISVIVVG